tara:strand:- start:1352 stop:1675 length:324 start_codon:yes stop_codon:yes gene_type:complete
MKKTNLLNLYNLLYNKESRYNPQPPSESSDYIKAKLIKDKISKIDKITSSSGLPVATWYTVLPSEPINYLYAPQMHPYDESDWYHHNTVQDDTEEHTEDGVIIIDMW